MESNRIFTDAELEEMGRRTLDVLLEAIDNGDKEKAKELSNRMYQEFKGLHDGTGVWVSALMSHIYENHGQENFSVPSTGRGIQVLDFHKREITHVARPD